jgi:catechol 2,3-dioxygenase-like lactoylglutathione lyase family enzyme
MKAGFGHIQFNVDLKNLYFYHDLMVFLGWRLLHQSNNMLGCGYWDGSSLWFTNPIHQVENDSDGFGMNHIAFHAESIENVDETVTFLLAKNIPVLFDTPRHRPEFSNGPEDTYYQVMFETPDKILMEIVYIGPK